MAKQQKQWNWAKEGSATQRNMERGMSTAQQGVQNMMERGREQLSSASYLRPLSNFCQDMDRLFEQTWRGFGMPAMFGGTGSLQETMFQPSVDITSTDTEYSIVVEVPGIDEKDVRIDLSADGQLTICGEKKADSDAHEKDFHRMERSFGMFRRTLSLPEDVNHENVEASFRNGVLTITALRTESAESRTRRIEVNAGDRQRDKNRMGGRPQDTTVSGSAVNTAQPGKRVA